MQQIFLGLGAAATKPYVDDVFSTYLWNGNDTARSIDNGIDLSGEGGLTWIKSRSNAESNWLFDTANGADWALRSNLDNARYNTGSPYMSSFNSNGFSIGTHNGVNDASMTYSSWSFRKATGFFDVVTYTGTGSARTESHNLGSVPGMILIKNLTDAEDWSVYHRATKATHALILNTTAAATDTNYQFNDTEPTASVFSLGTDSRVNGSGKSYVAYLFAGGESTASTARSVYFDGSDDKLVTVSADSGAFEMGTGDFTIEGWAKFTDDDNRGIFQISDTQYGLSTTLTGTIALGHNGNTASARFQIFAKDSAANYVEMPRNIGQWFHFALVRDSSVLKLYINGMEEFSTSDTTDYNGTYIVVGGFYTNSYLMQGNISNFRVTKGQALYTSSFKPSTTPIGYINSYTKLICCNDANAGAGGLIADGGALASIDSPFDDPAGFVFGDAEDQNIVKTGSYQGDGSATHRKIELGFEPQWIMTKRVDGGTSNWDIADMMRGTPADDDNANQNGSFLWANQNWAEATDRPFTTHSTGFGLKNTSTGTNGNGDTYIYMAIRRPDGAVGKPAEVGTDVFAMDTGNSSYPSFTSNFPVDFGVLRQPATSENWWNGTRLAGEHALRFNGTEAEVNDANITFDRNDGWYGGGGTNKNSNYQSWMWKRGAGFDVVAYKGNGTAGHQIRHNLSTTPEMMWVRSRTEVFDWYVYHSGVYSPYGPADSPQNYALRLNLNSGILDNNTYWNDTAPTSTHFTVGSANAVNEDNKHHIAMLFSSVTGISKVGTYTGNHAAREITTGFQPRFLIIKGQGTGTDNEWVVFDTTRGWASGVDNYLVLNLMDAQTNALDGGQPTSTGFTLTGGDDYRRWNDYGVRYIYYAHA